MADDAYGGSTAQELIGDEQEQCCGGKLTHWILAICVMTIIAVVLTLVAVVVGTVVESQKDSLHRIGIQASAANVVGASGEGNFKSDGLLELSETDNAFRWKLTVESGMSAVTSLVIRGPYVVGTRLGDVAGVLCGAVLLGPSQACDTLSAPGYVNGAVAYRIANNVDAAGVDIRPLLHAIRENCHLYYLEVLTNVKPTSPGAMRSSLCQFAGWK